MNRILLTVLVLLWSLLYSWFWNCYRKPHCAADEPMGIVEETVVAPAVVEDEPEPELTEEEKLLFTPLDVYFQVAKSGIARTPEVNSFLETAKAYLAQNPEKQLSITGHTDSDGSEATNQRLSENRANEVKNLLVADGFNESQLVTIGKGETDPVVPNDSPENKAKNRRVSIRLMD